MGLPIKTVIKTGTRFRILRGALGAGLALTVAACGTWQSVKDGTVDATRAVR